MHVITTAHFEIGPMVGLLLWLLLMRLSAVETDTLERLLAHAVVDALHMARVSRKEAAALMKVDYQQLGRQLRAEPGEHLSLTKMMRLCGTSFWFWFGPSLMLLVAREGYANLAETLLFIGKRRYGGTVTAIEASEESEQRRA